MAEGVPFESIYARRLERLLRAENGYSGTEVINAGVSGYSLYQGLTQLEREIIPCRPDIVTVLFGINDQDTDQAISDNAKARIFDSPLVSLNQVMNRSMTWYFFRKTAWQLRGALAGKTRIEATHDANPAKLVRRVSLVEYEGYLERIAALGKMHGFRQIFLVLPTSLYFYDTSLSEDSPSPMPDSAVTALELARANINQGEIEKAATGLETILDDYPGFAEARFTLACCYQKLGRFEDAHREFVKTHSQSIFAPYERVVRRVAEKRQITVVDLTAEFTAMRRDPLYFDDMHPDSAGHEIIARKLRDAILASMRAR
jgi:lysophospholipase L1-like esterase